MSMTMYFDNENGIQKETSHPHFTEHFKLDIYYDTAKKEAPFGSAVSQEVLERLTAYFKDKSDEGLNLSAFPKHFAEEKGISFVEPKDYDALALQKMREAQDENTRLSMQIAVSAALGQIKITGYILPVLRDKALDALHVLKEIETDESGYYDQMFYDLLTFTKDYTAILPELWCKRCIQ
ncbi:hypothetical protein X560_2465 [Listeria fleischmannii 1991]|nr:hypothetical protein X560_2465 [Listeria fleischmannii 1991]